MPRRILIHGGFHKTGNTAVQTTLRDNRVAMKKHVALRLRWHLKDLIAATHAYSNDRDPALLEAVQGQFETLLTDLPGMPRRTLILSAPELAGHMPGRPGVADYAAAPDLFYVYWERARTHFPNAEIAFFLTTRAPDAWLASVYAQHLAASDLTLDLPAYRARYGAAADLEAMVAEIASRVPAPVHHTTVEECATLRLGPADPLLDLCHLPADLRQALVPAAPPETGEDPALLRALLDANRTHADPKTRQAAKEALRRQAGAA